MRTPIVEIRNSNAAITSALNRCGNESRGEVARSVFSDLRNLVDHLLVYSVFGDTISFPTYYDAIKAAEKSGRQKKELRHLIELHSKLQQVSSHYTPTPESAERLFISYFDLMLKTKLHASTHLGIEILENLESFPLEEDTELTAFYAQIAEQLHQLSGVIGKSSRKRYYVCGSRPIIANRVLFYETTLSPVADYDSKTNRIIAYTALRLPDNYAIKFASTSITVHALGKQLPVTIITNAVCSIPIREINLLAKICGSNTLFKTNSPDYAQLMEYLTNGGWRLDQLVALNEQAFVAEMNSIFGQDPLNEIAAMLKTAHRIVVNGLPGCNILSYLFARPRSYVLRNQISNERNSRLSKLRLKYECIPFDKMPFSFSLVAHNPSDANVSECISPLGHEDESVAKLTTNHAQVEDSIYLSDAELKDLDIDALIESYNRRLYYKHKSQEIIHRSGHLYVKEDEQCITSVIKQLQSFSGNGIPGHKQRCVSWLNSPGCPVDDDAKREALPILLEKSKVALIFGSAGTGKTTLVSHLCAMYSGVQKIAIANTNAAVENLRRRTGTPLCEYMTVTRYLKSNTPETALLIVDECSTIKNRDMESILLKGGFSALILIGDIRQIESISLGNWFSLTRYFLPEHCIFEFTKPFRPTRQALSDLWNAVRTNDSRIVELLEANAFSSPLNENLFSVKADDEVILCPNYNGIFGINSLNRIMQLSNPGRRYLWGLNEYRVGDPVLFGDSPYSDILFNNLKGRIVGIDSPDESRIVFDLEVDRSLSALDLIGSKGLAYICSVSTGKTVIRMALGEAVSPEGESDYEEAPFVVSYAVSIHKAQGLEFDSVKLVIPDYAERRISHNILYTAITRARKHLTIFWSPETQNTILSNLTISDTHKDAALISNHTGLKMNKRPVTSS